MFYRCPSKNRSHLALMKSGIFSASGSFARSSKTSDLCFGRPNLPIAGNAVFKIETHRAGANRKRYALSYVARLFAITAFEVERHRELYRSYDLSKVVNR